MMTYKLEDLIGKITCADCLDVLRDLPDKCVDLVLTDPPYGTTACKWDSVIPFDEMWKELKRIRKDAAPILLFGKEPFSSHLRLSNLSEYKYDYVWHKDRPTGLFTAKLQPMRYYELISVFYACQPYYSPQMSQGIMSHSRGKGNAQSKHYPQAIFSKNLSDKKYPSDVLFFKRPHPPIHPTQKPIELLEYLIKTYSKEGDIVLDFTSGSGSLAIACHNLKRRFICIEKDPEYHAASLKRLEEAQKQQNLF